MAQSRFFASRLTATIIIVFMMVTTASFASQVLRSTATRLSKVAEIVDVEDAGNRQLTPVIDVHYIAHTTPDACPDPANSSPGQLSDNSCYNLGGILTTYSPGLPILMFKADCTNSGTITFYAGSSCTNPVAIVPGSTGACVDMGGAGKVSFMLWSELLSATAQVIHILYKRFSAISTCMHEAR